MSNKSAGEEELARQLDALGIAYEREFRFAKPRRWRFDFVLGGSAVDRGIAVSDAVQIQKVAVEVEGGQWTGGHRRGAEANKDCEKSNAAVVLGWRVLRFTPYMVETGEALEVIEAALGRKS